MDLFEKFKILLRVRKLDKEVGYGFSSYLKNALKDAEEFINKLFENKRKVVRTEFVKEALSDCYPSKIYNYSILFDHLTAIGDDLYDNENPAEIRGKYLLMFGNHLYDLLDKEELRDLAKTFLINLFYVMISEKSSLILYNKTRQTELLKYHYIGRAVDILIFIEVLKLHKKTKKKLSKDWDSLKRVFLLFRAINLLKKDIKDIEWDLKNKTQTAVTLLLDKKENLKEFCDYLIKDIEREFDKIKMKKECAKQIKQNLRNMIKKEKLEIYKELENLNQ